MAKQCRWTVTDEDGNKYDVRDLALVGANGRTWQIGPSHGRERGKLSWAKAQRMLRRGTADLVLSLPGLGEVMLPSGSSPGGFPLEKDRKVSEYRWGCPAGVMVRGAAGDGTPVWREPTDVEHAALADSLLLSTLSRVNSASKESSQHARAVAAAAAARLLGDSALLRTGGSVADNQVMRRLVAASLSTSGDGDERAALLALEAAVAGALSAGRSFGPEVADIVAECYPRASTADALMLALGLIPDSESASFDRYNWTPEDMGSAQFYASRLGAERADALKAREDLLLSGSLRQTAVDGGEGRYGDVVKDALSLKRVQEREGYLLPDLTYERMPFLPELVSAAATYTSDPDRFRDALYRAECAYPGTLLWASAHSRDPSLQSAALLSLAASSDIEYVKAQAAMSHYEGVWGSLSPAALARLEGSLTIAGPGEESAEASKLLEQYPALRGSRPFMRSVFDGVQDSFMFWGDSGDPGSPGDARLSTSLPSPKMQELAGMVFPARDDVPAWLLDPDALSTARDLSLPGNLRAGFEYTLRASIDGGASVNEHDRLPADVVRATLPEKVRNLSELAAGVHLLNAGVSEFLSAHNESVLSHGPDGSLLSYYVKNAIDELSNAPGGPEMLEGMAGVARSVMRPDLSRSPRALAKLYSSGRHSELRSVLSDVEMGELESLEWQIEGSSGFSDAGSSSESEVLELLCAHGSGQASRRYEDRGRGARKSERRPTVGERVDTRKLLILRHLMGTAKSDIASELERSEARRDVLVAQADARLTAREREAARQRAGLAARQAA